MTGNDTGLQTFLRQRLADEMALAKARTAWIIARGEEPGFVPLGLTDEPLPQHPSTVNPLCGVLFHG